MKKGRLWVVWFAIFLFGAMVSSTRAGTEDYKEISAPEVKDMIDKGDAMVIHVLSRIEYEMQHIPGSINIPIIEIKNTDKLPQDKGRPIVFYCMGKRWPYSIRAARIAAKKGYTEVYAFIGGIPEWRKFNYPMVINKEWQKIKIKKIPPKKFARLLEEKDFYILDVRPLNFKKNTSFIKGSFLCPLVFLADRYKEIPKDRQIVITDWAMKQSPVVAKYLTAKGYPIIAVLKGGIERWEEEGFPVEQRVPTQELLPLSPQKNR